jgi:hypothetical protein
MSVRGGREVKGTRRAEERYSTPRPKEGGLELAKNRCAPSSKHQRVLGASHDLQIPAQRRRGRPRRYRTGHKKPTSEMWERLKRLNVKVVPDMPERRRNKRGEGKKGERKL